MGDRTENTKRHGHRAKVALVVGTLVASALSASAPPAVAEDTVDAVSGVSRMVSLNARFTVDPVSKTLAATPVGARVDTLGTAGGVETTTEVPLTLSSDPIPPPEGGGTSSCQAEGSAASRVHPYDAQTAFMPTTEGLGYYMLYQYRTFQVDNARQDSDGYTRQYLQCVAGGGSPQGDGAKQQVNGGGSTMEDTAPVIMLDGSRWGVGLDAANPPQVKATLNFGIPDLAPGAAKVTAGVSIPITSAGGQWTGGQGPLPDGLVAYDPLPPRFQGNEVNGWWQKADGTSQYRGNVSEALWEYPMSDSTPRTIQGSAFMKYKSDCIFGFVCNETTASTPGPTQPVGPRNVAAIAGGAFHSLALKGDGTVRTWGYNAQGQLGDGTTTNRGAPLQVADLTGVTGIAGGGYHSLAVKTDGTVWAWGSNSDGQLGDGTTTNGAHPVKVNGLSGVAAITGGAYHSLALKGDGTVWAWGLNVSGQLGDGTTTNRATPVQVSNLSGVTAIAGGTHYSLALKGNGTAWSWGSNSDGQLGDGTTTNRALPVQVTGTSGFVGISAGAYHSLALMGDGTVRAWGWNISGQLGDGTTASRTTPVQVQDLGGVTAIAAGGYHSLALKADASLWAWGANSDGQLGDGSTTNRSTPGAVIGVI